MATRQDVIGARAASAERAPVIGGLRFDALIAALSAWLIGGAYLDGWAHAHGKVDTSFFTPWHAVLYSGYLAVAIALCATMIINQRRGASWGRALPPGYELSLIGVAVFGLGGAGDVLWHTAFGIEKGIEALFSPTHLLLVVGATLIVSGPARAAWQRARTERGDLIGFLPLLISLTLFLSALTFILQFAHPFVYTGYLTGTRRPGSADLVITASAATILLQTGLLMGMIMLALRRWTLPFGSLLLILTLNAALLSTQDDTYFVILPALMTGLLGDALLRVLKPSINRANTMRVFGFVLPVIWWGLFFLTLATTQGMWWSIHVWTGVLFMAGCAGLLISFLAVPPQMPTAAD
ncbi:MAG: hypothetical protein IT324_30595 [Anaerolineae bacterium]|nr:hypothetical protein [Anaerolineae bacterium]